MSDISQLLVDNTTEEFEIEYGGTKFKFAKRPLSWANLNKILGECIEVAGEQIKFDLARYNEECLIAMLTETPDGWPKEQTGLILKQLKAEVGALFEVHIPKPGSVFGEESDFFVNESEK